MDSAIDGASTAPLLEVSGLRVELPSGADIVGDISLRIAPGRVLGLVGESGSGKSTIALALLGHARDGARITAGRVRVAGHELLDLDADALRRLRGSLVAHVAQDPAAALNPLRRIGTQLREVLEIQEPALAADAREARVLQALEDVGLPAETGFLRRFPHQLSGGQQQRVLLALAFATRPRLIVMDEPTTALDVTTQAKVLLTVRELCRRHGVAAVYVSHDLAVVRNLADEVVVLYAGRIVEQAPLRQLFDAPRHPYTQGLLAAIPDVAERRPPRPIPGQAPAPGHRPGGCAFAPRCPIARDDCHAVAPKLEPATPGRVLACHHADAGPAFHRGVVDRVATSPAASAPLLEVERVSAWYGDRQVLFEANLSLAPGECLALVGESGSGKTTLARALAGIGEQATGTLRYAGTALPLKSRQRPADQRRQVQYIFQNPYRSLNPSHTVGETLTTAARHFFGGDAADTRRRVDQVLAQVALPASTAGAYPRELSGGERQRVAIARALICEPRLLICDEVTSALDVSVQSTILDLLARLQRGGLALLFVTHDLGVVRAIAQRVAVLRHGVLVEQGPVERVLDDPAEPYTRQLVVDSPSLTAESRRLPPRRQYRFAT
ncbi:peptide ABC transporter ATP-binding protein [Roseateles aquatilis]|uniref:Peptide ABC transporter ATP-binding protein n=1 Tax=Roseateles aquatilis TaxID=431061 RepID=A0A246JI56_9BURK|nr:peptide ABC transporter ATP-binding protein [Roseateles aquatilis]